MAQSAFLHSRDHRWLAAWRMPSLDDPRPIPDERSALAQVDLCQHTWRKVFSHMHIESSRPIHTSFDRTRLVLPALASVLSVFVGFAIAAKVDWSSQVAAAGLFSLALIVALYALDLFKLADDVQAQRWILAGYVIRVCYARFTWPIYGLDDEGAYHVAGILFKEQMLAGQTLTWRNGYPAILGVLYTLLGEHYLVGRLFNCVVGALVLAVVYRTALAIFQKQDVARVALIGAALHPYLVVYSGVQVREVYVVLFAAGSLWALVSRRPWTTRVAVFAVNTLGFMVTRSAQAVAFLAAGFCHQIFISLRRKRLGLVLIMLVLLLVSLRLYFLPQYQSTWAQRWEGRYTLTDGAQAGMASFSGVSARLIDPFDPSFRTRLLSFGRQLFTPLPTHFLAGINLPRAIASLYGLYWYVSLPFLGLGAWYHRRRAEAWLLLGIVLGHLILLSMPQIAFAGEPQRWRLAAAPALILLSASGYVTYAQLEPARKRRAAWFLVLAGATLLSIIGLYTYLAW